YDAPQFWSSEGYKIPQIIDFRSQLINSRFKSLVKNANNKFLELTQEVALANKPVDVEFKLEKKPFYRVNLQSHVAPMGPSASLKQAMLTENPHIPRKVDKVVSDTELLSANGLVQLYEKGIDENYLTQILSVGQLGLAVNRKLVPTRWSITATDDTIGKHLIENVKQFSKQTEFQCYFGGYIGNYYLILFFPEAWSYELFETYAEVSVWNPTGKIQFMTDNEWYSGRKEYAHDTAGGYYAARLGILEKLNSLKRQGSVLALRFITKEYAVPLGVWVVREATRRALESKPIHFASKELMLHYARLKIKKEFNFNLDLLLKESKLLKEIKEQKKLFDFAS
ncbi:hypothetical protein KY335_05950, partial [Candidatus Woesearchaeota archaeon]|nr:hypothetical protein [Candidatus Woesearchaeota archaeon]